MKKKLTIDIMKKNDIMKYKNTTETYTGQQRKKKTLISQKKHMKRMGVLPEIQTIKEKNQHLQKSAYKNTGLYWIISIIMFVLYFFYRKYKTRNTLKKKNCIKKKRLSW